MYAGSTLTPMSGRILGAHQKIDRVARRHLKQLAPHAYFPHIRGILQFEGWKGPDAIKRKSPGKDEPGYFIAPFDPADTQLIKLVERHYQALVEALRQKDSVRSSFEAAWLAHSVVDGLTPAHHYPYEAELAELRGGEGSETRDSIKNKILLPGDTLGVQVSNNVKMWGPGGLFTTHALFEWGFAIVIAPSHLRWRTPTQDKIDAFSAQPLDVWFRAAAQDIAKMRFYDEFIESGWTLSLARRVKAQLAPMIMEAVTLIWLGAAEEAQTPH